MIQRFKKYLPFPLILILIFAAGATAGWYISKHPVLHIPSGTVYQKNSPESFYEEVYDKIKENYWENITDEALIQGFKDASSAQGEPISSDVNTKSELIKALNQEKAVKITTQLLTNLKPLGRSGLFTSKQKEQLNNTVANVNPDKDLYKDLDLNKGASESAVADAYDKKQEVLKKENTPESLKKLKDLAYAKDVLTKKDSKKRYDGGGVEPTIFTKVLPNTLYLQFIKFSPTSLEEIQKAFEENKQSLPSSDGKDASLDSLIFDLRGNIGGAIDQTAYLIGFFIGRNQLAFDFYRKDDFLPLRTPTDKLPSVTKYKNIVILIDNQTQSSAELLAASFKKYNLGVVVGSPTRGWGTVEKIFQLENQVIEDENYSIFLVHSITLRDDNQPIEGRGVDPDINLTDPNWEKDFNTYSKNSSLLNAVKGVI